MDSERLLRNEDFQLIEISQEVVLELGDEASNFSITLGTEPGEGRVRV
jgi:hypothetical protein